MTKYKEYLRKKGIKLACDFPYMPYDEGTQNIIDVWTRCNDNNIVVFIEYSSLVVCEIIDRNGKMKIEDYKQNYEEDIPFDEMDFERFERDIDLAYNYDSPLYQ